MGNLAFVFEGGLVGELSADDINGVFKAPNIDKAKIDRKETRRKNKPDNNEGQVCISDFDGIKDKARECVGERLNRFIDRGVYTANGDVRRKGGFGFEGVE